MMRRKKPVRKMVQWLPRGHSATWCGSPESGWSVGELVSVSHSGRRHQQKGACISFSTRGENRVDGWSLVARDGIEIKRAEF